MTKYNTLIQNLKYLAVGLSGLLLFAGCAGMGARTELDSRETRVAQQLGMDVPDLEKLKFKPLYKMEPAEIDRYLRFLYIVEPDLQKRIVHLARKNLGQPYEIYLLGEYPYELYDPQPLYELSKSDCVVFSEHTFAMALSSNWPEFFHTLMKLRYKDGKISVLSRNHYTVADWDRSNAWFLKDITRKVGGEKAAPLNQVVRRKAFFKKRYGLETDIPDQKVKDWYVPREVILENMDRLQAGDFVNVIRGNENSQYAGHVGLITKGENGETYFLHSTPPKVKEEPLAQYLEKTKNRTLGMKFLRPRYKELKDFNVLAAGK